VNKARFAPVTASLLARKGDARPWQAPSYEPRALSFGPEHPADCGTDCKPSPEPSDHPRIAAVSRITSATTSEAPAEWTKRLSLALPSAEFERLGIAAVKKGISRQQIVRDAIDFYIAHTLITRCECLSDSSSQGNCSVNRESQQSRG
jgi:hypothetical protein